MVSFIYNCFERNRKLIFVSYFVCLLVFFPFYSCILSNPDGLLFWDIGAMPVNDVTHGSWGSLLVQFIRPFVNNAPLTYFVTLFFWAVGGALFVDLFDIKSESIKLITNLCIVCQPMVASTLTYPCLSFDFSISFMFAILAILISIKCEGKYSAIVLGTLILALSISVRQFNVGTAAVAGLMYIIYYFGMQIGDSHRCINKAKRILIVGVMGIALYYVILKVILKVMGISMSSYGGGDKINFLYIIANLNETIKNAYINFFDFFLHSNIMINSLHVKEFYLLFFLLFIACILFLFWSMRNKIINVFILVCLISIIPIACNLINLFAPDYNVIELHMSSGMCLIIPFVFVLFITITGRLRSKKNLIFKSIGVFLMIFLIWNYTIIDSVDASLMQVIKDETVSLGNRIKINIEMDPNYNEDMSLVIIGTPDYDIDGISYFGLTNSYARWGLFWGDAIYTHSGWIQIFEHYIDGNIKWGSWDDVNRILATDAYKNMPLYPARDSMKIIDECFVVKVSNNI